MEDARTSPLVFVNRARSRITITMARGGLSAMKQTKFSSRLENEMSAGDVQQ